MNRRQYLAGIAAVTALAGCSSARPGSTGGSAEDENTDAGGPGSSGGGEGTSGGGGSESPGGNGVTPPSNFELPVPESELTRGAPKDGIPAIVDPVFGADWSDVGDEDTQLGPDDLVIGVERAGEARAYPLLILNWHEIVNDTLDGPLLVTYCPLCGSGVTAERTVDGEETVFGVSGYLWNSDLVMYDQKTDSLWSQILGQSIRGPKTGARLSLVPSSITTWSEWQDTHPETVVLLPPPESGMINPSARPRDYTRNPYSSYGESDRIGIGFNDVDDDRLHPKATVIGVTVDGSSKAYPLQAVGNNAVVNDTVGDLPIVVTTTEAGSLFAYERTVDGDTLTFENADATHARAGGSRWNKTTGRAVDGPHEGTHLVQANDRSQMFWFAWVDFHSETELYS